jgi:hypothetical protein
MICYAFQVVQIVFASFTRPFRSFIKQKKSFEELYSQCNYIKVCSGILTGGATVQNKPFSLPKKAKFYKDGAIND